MEQTLNEKIIALQTQIKELQAQFDALNDKVYNKDAKIYTVAGGNRDNALNRSTDIATGMGRQQGAPMAWNDSELGFPPYSIAEPPTPTVGYNNHSHSRYSGGALINGVIEIIEYVWGTITNKHSQQYYTPKPEKATAINSKNETVFKVGLLELFFNPDSLTWGTEAMQIDVNRCYLVERDINGVIALDSKGNQKKSLLYNADATKTALCWDESAGVWRWYAVYAPDN